MPKDVSIGKGRFTALHQALDEARFGAARTLNLRASLPTVAQALGRAESWLRERQVTQAGEVLIITGRGNQSEAGVSAVRQAIVRLLASLRRRGVVAEVSEHTAGSFVVRLAPISSLREAARRKGERQLRATLDPKTLTTLQPATRQLLRRLALRALDELGVRDAAPFVEGEMVSQFSLLAAGIPDGPEREDRLRTAIGHALLEYDDR